MHLRQGCGIQQSYHKYTVEMSYITHAYGMSRWDQENIESRRNMYEIRVWKDWGQCLKSFGNIRSVYVGGYECNVWKTWNYGWGEKWGVETVNDTATLDVCAERGGSGTPFSTSNLQVQIDKERSLIDYTAVTNSLHLDVLDDCYVNGWGSSI